MAEKKRYDTALRSLPGMTFRIDIADPKERVQAYLDSFRDERNDVRPPLFSDLSSPLPRHHSHLTVVRPSPDVFAPSPHLRCRHAKVHRCSRDDRPARLRKSHGEHARWGCGAGVRHVHDDVHGADCPEEFLVVWRSESEIRCYIPAAGEGGEYHCD